MPPEYETLIIGAGMAGLGCARTLHDHGASFAVVSEDVGGRVLASDDGKVNYGAYFLAKDYRHVLPYVDLDRRLSATTVEFHHDGETYSLLRSSHHVPELLRLARQLFRFGRHYHKLREASALTEQKDAIEADPYLLELYHRPARAFLDEVGLTGIFEELVGELVYAMAFSPVVDLSAFELLLLSRYAVTVPVYSFRFRFDRLTAGFEDALHSGCVARIDPHEGGYRVTMSTGAVWRAVNVVVATPPSISHALLDLDPIKPGVDTWMFHVEGDLGPDYAGGRFEVFDRPSALAIITTEADGTHIIYGLRPDADLSAFFPAGHRVLRSKAWRPAFHMGGQVLWPCEIADGLFVVGDHNVCSLEDSFLTGLYAANRILGFAP